MIQGDKTDAAHQTTFLVADQIFLRKNKELINIKRSFQNHSNKIVIVNKY